MERGIVFGKQEREHHFESRAVTRLIGPGCDADCPHCEAPVKFMARVRATQVICNVYEDGRWDRVEHFHSPCYEDAGSPYGDPDTSKLRYSSRGLAETPPEVEVVEPTPRALGTTALR